MGERISLRAARVNRNMNQTQAANAIGVSDRTLSRWEQGDAYPRSDQFLELCKLYGVSADSIILRKDFG